ncbi:predicted protein [Histoplasma capsulatum H143]|uniref:Uncharacterized protein n=1 Tax=Ajellomyces capsulatus (strain H143) TaxID=544712 RepID=C6HFA9_AJECH|nr:predicted protein [Histoplasma capsulatum H143]
MIQHDPTRSNTQETRRLWVPSAGRHWQSQARAGKGRHALSADQADQVSRSGCLATGKPGWDVLCFSADSVSGLGSGDRGLYPEQYPGIISRGQTDLCAWQHRNSTTDSSSRWPNTKVARLRVRRQIV